jgi:uncharacterized protein
MTTYKVSRYVYSVTQIAKTIVYSTNTQGIFLLDPEEAAVFRELEKQTEFDIHDYEQNDFVHHFQNAGLLIPSNYDEIEEVLMCHEQSLAESDTLHLTLFVTDECDFNCAYCFVDKTERNTMNINVQEQIFTFVQNQIKKNHYQRLDVSWFGGEPLLCVDSIVGMMGKFNEICMNHNHIHLTASIVTNGYELTLNNFLRLYHAGVRQYQVTLDGDPELHNEFRKHYRYGDTFQVIFKNILTIRRTNLDDFSLTVRCNYTHENIDKTNQLIEMYMKHFKRDGRFHFALKPIVDYSTEDQKALLTIYNGRVADLSAIGNKYPAMKELMIQLLGKRKNWCMSRSPHSFVINALGQIFTCDSSINDKRYMIGRIDENGELCYTELNQYYNTYDLKEKCKQCKRLPLCYGSCVKIFKKTNVAPCVYTDHDIHEILSFILSNEEAYA